MLKNFLSPFAGSARKESAPGESPPHPPRTSSVVQAVAEARLTLLQPLQRSAGRLTRQQRAQRDSRQILAIFAIMSQPILIIANMCRSSTILLFLKKCGRGSSKHKANGAAGGIPSTPGVALLLSLPTRQGEEKLKHGAGVGEVKSKTQSEKSPRRRAVGWVRGLTFESVLHC